MAPSKPSTSRPCFISSNVMQCVLAVSAALLCVTACNKSGTDQPTQEPQRDSEKKPPARDAEAGALPAPAKEAKVSLEQALAKRRSIRRFKPDALSRRQIAQLCWAAQGVSDKRTGFRTAPSAGALYPLELYVVTADGVEHYVPSTHTLKKHLGGDLRTKLQAAALRQSPVGRAPATFVFAAVYARTQRKYGRRARQYVHMEVGHAGQNLLLQATALGLGAVPIGAFVDGEVAKLLKLPANHAPLYLIPVGVPAK